MSESEGESEGNDRSPLTIPYSLLGKALGSVVINLQRTHLDADCTIRVWAKLDDAFRLLAEYLGMEISQRFSEGQLGLT